MLLAQSGTKEKGETIQFKMKNNGLKFINAYVEGPKVGGGNFSYGFNIGPYTSIDKKWTVGTRLYKVSGKHQSELIYEFTAADDERLFLINRAIRDSN